MFDVKEFVLLVCHRSSPPHPLHHTSHRNRHRHHRRRRCCCCHSVPSAELASGFPHGYLASLSRIHSGRVIGWWGEGETRSRHHNHSPYQWPGSGDSNTVAIVSPPTPRWQRATTTGAIFKRILAGGYWMEKINKYPLKTPSGGNNNNSDNNNRKKTRGASFSLKKTDPPTKIPSSVFVPAGGVVLGVP